MPEKEILTASNYIVWEERVSRFDREAIISVKVGLRCPRCKEMLPVLEHGDKQMCPNCSLRMQLLGNALYVWEAEYRIWFLDSKS
jgi:Zn finger protein HypA/HybF involved in hydrogenase expression